MREKWENIIWGETLDDVKREIAESFRRRGFRVEEDFKTEEIARHLAQLLYFADEKGLSIEMLLSDYMINHERRFK